MATSNEDPKSISGFSEREINFLVVYIKNMKKAPEVDWDAIAQQSGYDNVASARKYFNRMKAKHGIAGSNDGAGSTKGNKKVFGQDGDGEVVPAKNGKGSKKVSGADGEEQPAKKGKGGKKASGQDGDGEGPAKKGKGSKKPSVLDGYDGGDESLAKKRKGGKMCAGQDGDDDRSAAKKAKVNM